METYNIIIGNKQLHDFNPVMFGCETCESGYQFVSMRDYYLVHYIVDGEGEIFIDDKCYRATAGQIFLIKKDQLCRYRASQKNPWTYIWIGFIGEIAEKFSELPTLMDYKSNLFIEMLSVKSMESMQEEYLAGKIFQLYVDLFQQNSVSKYAENVKFFIDSGYMSHVTVEEIANSLNLNRRYLSRIFKKEIGLSIQEYLISVRINKATGFLKQGFSIRQVANLVGYDDQFAFSKIYKKHTGVTPEKIKKSF